MMIINIPPNINRKVRMIRKIVILIKGDRENVNNAYILVL